MLDLNYFSFSNSNPNPNQTHLKTKLQALSHQFSQRIWYAEYYSVHAHMAWSQKLSLTPDSKICEEPDPWVAEPFSKWNGTGACQKTIENFCVLNWQLWRYKHW